MASSMSVRGTMLERRLLAHQLGGLVTDIQRRWRSDMGARWGGLQRSQGRTCHCGFDDGGAGPANCLCHWRRQGDDAFRVDVGGGDPDDVAGGVVA
jgi:hypothetical protein